MADKLMYIPNADTQIYPFCRLHSVFVTFGHSTLGPTQHKFPKILKKKVLRDDMPTNNKRYYKTLGTNVINSPISPSSLLTTNLFMYCRLIPRTRFGLSSGQKNLIFSFGLRDTFSEPIQENIFHLSLTSNTALSRHN